MGQNGSQKNNFQSIWNHNNPQEFQSCSIEKVLINVQLYPAGIVKVPSYNFLSHSF